MDKKEFNTLLNNLENVSEQKTEALEKLKVQYPYFQNIHLLLAKAYKVSGSGMFKSSLNSTAVRSPDRALLKEIIEGPKSPQPAVSKKPEETKGVNESKEDVYEELENNLNALNLRKKNLDKLLSDNTTPAKAKQPAISDRESQLALIEKFIKNEPQLDKQKLIALESENDQEDLSSKSLKHKDDLVTETLAELMVKQQKIKKATQIYKKLSLKFPEKKTYFASRIEKINQSK